MLSIEEIQKKIIGFKFGLQENKNVRTCEYSSEQSFQFYLEKFFSPQNQKVLAQANLQSDMEHSCDCSRFR